MPSGSQIRIDELVERRLVWNRRQIDDRLRVGQGGNGGVPILQVEQEDPIPGVGLGSTGFRSSMSSSNLDRSSRTLSTDPTLPAAPVTATFTPGTLAAACAARP